MCDWPITTPLTPSPPIQKRNYFRALFLGFGTYFHKSYCFVSRHNFFVYPFYLIVPFLYSLKTSKNLWFSDIFRDYTNGKLDQNELNKCKYNNWVLLRQTWWHSPADIYLFKVNNRNTRKSCEIFSKLTIKTKERCQWRNSGVFIVNFERISNIFLALSKFAQS